MVVATEQVTYGTYLRLKELLSLQEPHVGVHDERTFIVVHQLYELCFSLMLYELEVARAAMFAADAPKAFRALRRVGVIDQIMVAQIDLIETILPQDFLAFRPALETGSGFQSVQFREVEFLCGLKDTAYLERLHDLTPEDRARLQKRLDEPTVWDGFVTLLAMDDTSVEQVYRDRDRHPWFFSIAEAMVDHDEGMARWRAHHVLMVERELGTKPGTGGGGAKYLYTTLNKRFFPELWSVRSIL